MFRAATVYPSRTSDVRKLMLRARTINAGSWMGGQVSHPLWLHCPYLYMKDPKENTALACHWEEQLVKVFSAVEIFTL